MARLALVLCIAVAVFCNGVAGQAETNSRSDKITQALAASADAIQSAASGRSDARAAADKSRAFARMTVHGSAAPQDFAKRHLLQAETNSRSDKITQALAASADAIQSAASGRSDARAAADKSRAFARMTVHGNAAPQDFAKRLLLQAETNSRSDKITQALAASADAIQSAASGRSDARAAADKSRAFARMTVHGSAAPQDFAKH